MTVKRPKHIAIKVFYEVVIVDEDDDNNNNKKLNIKM
jgi:hypothetical protein